MCAAHRRPGGGALTTLPGAAPSGRSAHGARPIAPPTDLAQPDPARPPRTGRSAAPLFTPKPAEPAEPPPARVERAAKQGGSAKKQADAAKKQGDAAKNKADVAKRSDYVEPKVAARPVRRLPAGLGAFIGVAVLTVVAHTLAATFTSLWVATAGEARFAVGVLAIRDATVADVPLTPWDHLAAIQYAAVQLVLPAGSPVDTARWAGLALGALATLLMWPVLRGLGNSVAATSIAVAALGVALPLLALRSTVTTAVVGVVWLSVAAALAVRDNIRAAGVAALLAVVTVPLAAAPLLAVAAAVSFDGTARLPGRLRKPVGVVAALAAAAVVLAVVLPGAPFAATTGPGIPAAIALAGVAVVVVVVVLASRADSLLRPVLVAAAPLVVVGLVPGPSGASNAAAAGLLVTPVVALAIAIAADQVHARVQRKPLRVAIALALAAVLAVPVSVAASWPTPSGGSLTGWVTTQTGPATVVVADPLDRAELRLAGFPAARLRTPTDPAVAGQLRLIAQRPGTDVVACPPGAVLASTPSGSGGAPAVVCGALTPATAVEAKVRARLGSALTTNTALKLDPGAASLLRDGNVDPRLMLTLAALTSAHRVGVAEFRAVPLDAPDALRRVVVLSAFDGTAPASSALLKTWLAGQQAPFAPGSVTADGPDLVLAYPVPSPTGLLPL